MTKIFNPVVRKSIPWYLRFVLFFIPLRWSNTTPIKGYQTTFSLGYKKLFGVTYIVK